ncbi:hypothetical protein [Solitalea lacus]|uniref:hypothetical protein n=1 Tax=Solitalea lacus TaxID=2911172 RepID=UPI001EDA66A0|nr:hypothetical protein [Solitalea lacus]UKJ09401.1 hypothetical protein L2B55_11290 [Solitalea lacus]
MARNKNREYKKGKHHRDFRKFVIVAEGQREDEYFNFFGELNRRVVVEIVPREEGKSAAKHLLERLENTTMNTELNLRISSGLFWTWTVGHAKKLTTCINIASTKQIGHCL